MEVIKFKFLSLRLGRENRNKFAGFSILTCFSSNLWILEPPGRIVHFIYRLTGLAGNSNKMKMEIKTDTEWLPSARYYRSIADKKKTKKKKNGAKPDRKEQLVSIWKPPYTLRLSCKF